jgi:hypothetical protein
VLQPVIIQHNKIDMSHKNRKYVIIAKTEKDNINFDDILTSSFDGAREDISGNNILLSYIGDTPSFLEGKTTYTESDIKTVMNSSDWTVSGIVD